MVDVLYDHSWAPLFEGTDRTAALDVVIGISRQVTKLADASSYKRVERHRRISLMTGCSGLALFQYYVGTALGNAEAHDSAAVLADEAIQGLPDHAGDGSLFSGLAGLGWVLSHLGLGEEDECAATICGRIDSSIQQALQNSRATQNISYDLVRGLVGLGVYISERPSTSVTNAIRAELLEQVKQLSEVTEDGISWPSQATNQAAQNGRPYYYDLGLAHGVPGVVAYLSGELEEEGTEQKSSRYLLEESTRWLLAQASMPASRKPTYPSFIGRVSAVGTARTAWCYGDPGVSIALVRAGQALGSNDLTSVGADLARNVALRPPDDAEIRNFGLCHGAAGLGHLLNRLYWSTRDPHLAHAAKYWLKKAMDIAANGLHQGGIFEPGTPGRTSDHNLALLEGATGVGLALLAAATPTPPRWDRTLLLSAG